MELFNYTVVWMSYNLPAQFDAYLYTKIICSAVLDCDSGKCLTLLTAYCAGHRPEARGSRRDLIPIYRDGRPAASVMGIHSWWL